MRVDRSRDRFLKEKIATGWMSGRVEIHQSFDSIFVYAKHGAVSSLLSKVHTKDLADHVLIHKRRALPPFRSG